MVPCCQEVLCGQVGQAGHPGTEGPHSALAVPS